jgi:hypothetical protein
MMPDKDSLLKIFYKELKFPVYFRLNWDSFDEGMNDLSWISADGYLIWIKKSELLLKSSNRDRKIFFDLMCDCCNEWTGSGDGIINNTSKAFHVILQNT